MRRIHVIVSLAILCLSASTLRAQEFKVVVNAANTATSISKAELSKIFLKEQSSWKSGTAAYVVDQNATSEVRQAFSKAVLGKDVSSVKSYWQQQIFSGRASPPVEKGSDADVMAAVAGNPGGVGYVSAGATPAAGTKLLTVGP